MPRSICLHAHSDNYNVLIFGRYNVYQLSLACKHHGVHVRLMRMLKDLQGGLFGHKSVSQFSFQQNINSVNRYTSKGYVKYQSVNI